MDTLTGDKPAEAVRPPVPIGTPTKFGRVCAFGIKDRERFYFVEVRGGFGLMPAHVIEDSVERPA